MTLDEWRMFRKRPEKLFFASLSYAVLHMKDFPCKLWIRHSMDTDSSAIYYVVETLEESIEFLKQMHPTKNKYAVEEKPADLIG